MDWLDLLAIQGILKSLLKHHSSKASILWNSAFFIVQVGCHFLHQCMKLKVKVKSLSHVRLLATSWIAAYQAPPSMGFSRQKYWNLWRSKWEPTPVFLPGKSHGQGSLVDYSSWGRKESDMTVWLNMYTNEVGSKLLRLSYAEATDAHYTAYSVLRWVCILTSIWSMVFFFHAFFCFH